MECFDKHQLQDLISTLHKVEQVSNVPIVFHNTLIDSLLQIYWLHNQETATHTTYQEFIEQIKFTPRVWNPNTSEVKMLQFITWRLNVNINIIGFKHSRRKSCGKHTNVCFCPYYVFQNTLVKLKSNVSMNIISYQGSYYWMDTSTTFVPQLINSTIGERITFGDIPVTTDSVLSIINKQQVCFPFNIRVFSSYHYVYQGHKNMLYSGFINEYKCDANDETVQTVNIFVTPYLDKSKIYLSVLYDMKDDTIGRSSISTIPQISEGMKMYQSKSQDNDDQETLNQDFCICDHPQTQRIFLASKTSLPLTSRIQKKNYLSENLDAVGLLTPELKKTLKICSELSILSFDTESLNNSIQLPEEEFVNTFQSHVDSKTVYGIQKLYTIGVFDSMPTTEALQIFRKYLPSSCFLKLSKYTTADCKHIRSHISWSYFKTQLANIDLTQCSAELVDLLSKDIKDNEKCVRIFHISKNETSQKGIEPTIEKTTQMIYNFMTYVYQRNVLASLIKYVLLKPLLQRFETFPYCKKGVFDLIKMRLNEILFECILTAFNGSNYDNYLICNSLILIQSKLRQTMKIYKKGSSLSTIYLKFKNNLNRCRSFNKPEKKIKTKPKTGTKNCWPLNLYIKDVRNLVSANVSLDKLGHLFNLNVSKLCFPYNQAVSIASLKQLTSLKPYDNDFWKDSFSNRDVTLETRINADKLFKEKQFKNLYEYGIYYLKLDCILLHSIVLTLFHNYLENDNINIIIRRNFSQSNLSYDQFFIHLPSQQIQNLIAPKRITNTFYNYLIRQAVTGGLCTSFVHGPVNKDTVINEHFNYLQDPNLDHHKWPNFYNCREKWPTLYNKIQSPKLFTETPKGILTFDIRSLYPSAALKKLPVGEPLFYSRFVPNDFQRIFNQKLSTYDLQSFCSYAQQTGNQHEDVFYLISKQPKFYHEYYALEHYLRRLPSNIKICRFQSKFTALGQLYVNNYPVDGFLSFVNLNDMSFNIRILQYNSVFYHGHTMSCKIKNNEEEQRNADKTADIKKNIICIFESYRQIFKLDHINFEYVEISDCDFFMHKLPLGKSYLFPHKKSYNYTSFLNNIYSKTLNGFLVVKNLEIKKNSQNPILGFLIQKSQYDFSNLSPYTQDLVTQFHPSKRVIAIHKTKNFMVISTEYFVWLHNTFGFEGTPDIYHALLFQTEYYLRLHIEQKLTLRKELKDLIKHETNAKKQQNYEIHSELIKLMLNSCYGFTLCNINSQKFKCVVLRKKFPTEKNRQKNIKSCIKINDNTFLMELNKKNEYPFQSLLGHVGCSILFHSKIILLKRMYFLLRYLNPTKAQLLYMDTDSAHFLVKHSNLINNVDSNLQSVFLQHFDKHFETGNKISGIWVAEGFFTHGEYIGEKSYNLSNDQSNTTLVHMKGLNTFFQNTYVTNKINRVENPSIAYNTFQKTSDFMIYKAHMSKNLFSNYIPIKRYFVCAQGSLPLKM